MSIEGKGFKQLTSAAEALKKIMCFVKEKKAEEISVKASVGRIAAENINSPIDRPPEDRSAFDGYAVISSDLRKASPEKPVKLRVVGTLHGGEKFQGEVRHGEAVQIMTGAAMPPNTDAVLMYEEVEGGKGYIRVFSSCSKWRNVSRKGEDVKKGETLLRKGERIDVFKASMLASLGIDKVKVVSKPSLSIIVTGSELVSPGLRLPPGKIYESNTVLLSSLAEAYNCEISKLYVTGDVKGEISEKLKESLLVGSDLVIVTGGMSAGRKDYSYRVIEEMGKILFHGVTLRPGTPCLGALINGKIVLGFPGSPAACSIAFIYFAVPLIEKMLGSKLQTVIKAKMKKSHPSTLGRMNALRVKLGLEGNCLYAYPLRIKGSNIISSLMKAEGLVFIDENKEGVEEGEVVDVYLFPLQ